MNKQTYEQIIISNLENRVTGVNSTVALSRIADFQAGRDALTQLIIAGLVEEIPMFFNGRDYKLYKLTSLYHARQQEAMHRRSYLRVVAGGRA